MIGYSKELPIQKLIIPK